MEILVLNTPRADKVVNQNMYIFFKRQEEFHKPFSRLKYYTGIVIRLLNC